MSVAVSDSGWVCGLAAALTVAILPSEPIQTCGDSSK